MQHVLILTIFINKQRLTHVTFISRVLWNVTNIYKYFLYNEAIYEKNRKRSIEVECHYECIHLAVKRKLPAVGVVKSAICKINIFKCLNGSFAHFNLKWLNVRFDYQSCQTVVFTFVYPRRKKAISWSHYTKQVHPGTELKRKCYFTILWFYWKPTRKTKHTDFSSGCYVSPLY